MPVPPALPGGFSDKAQHAAAYAGLCVVVLRAISGGWHRVSAGGAALAAGLTIAYGLTDEVHQIFVPGRTFDPADLLADAAGACAAATLAWSVARLGRRRSGLLQSGGLPPLK